MEPGLLQQLHLLDRGEAPEAVDERRVATHGDPSTHVLVVVEERHPDPVEVLPCDLVGRRPVEPVRAVAFSTRLVEVPE